jgi:cellulose synthase/poly-beta-1,6-N-acetylglucosamine synthase-like glycosyltransferase
MGRRTRTRAGQRRLGPFRQDYSEITGPIQDINSRESSEYRVKFTTLQATDGRGSYVRSIAIAGFNLALETLFLIWLLQPGHRTSADGPGWLIAANLFVIGAIGLMEVMRMINVVSLSLASIVARDPIPVRPAVGERVAFVTTIVPGKEPLEMVERTLAAARRIRYDGRLDVWLLDEGNDAGVKAMCARLGVHHFSRKGKPEFNQTKGAFKAKTKHGNYNSWLFTHGAKYSVMMSVDPDHVPLSNYAERILGYFRDPSIAYVVGPQCYANCDNFVTVAAESQQFPFHSVIQRAANRYGVAMLVGTNNAIRISAITSIGGICDSVTEDMATGLKLHATRNEATGKRWRSVYTPDVLAIGEGPSSWSDYFSQQLRWSRGTFELLRGEFWRRAFRLTPVQLLHYLLITTFYPSMAIGWILGGINALLFLGLGVSGVAVPVQIWLALYADATLFQMWLYTRNRRYNVSPSEVEGSTGAVGMIMSVLASPMYASSFVATILRRPAKFVVTAKGSATSADSLFTFKKHLGWALLLTGSVGAALLLGHATIESVMWPAMSLVVCLAPIALWRWEMLSAKKSGKAKPVARRLSATEIMMTPTIEMRPVREAPTDIRKPPQADLGGRRGDHRVGRQRPARVGDDQQLPART